MTCKRLDEGEPLHIHHGHQSMASNVFLSRIKGFLRSPKGSMHARISIGIAAAWTFCWIIGVKDMREQLDIQQPLELILGGYAIWIVLGNLLLLMPRIAFSRRARGRGRMPASIDYDSMDGYEFEHFCRRILIKNGFGDVTVTKGSGDQGVDILATKDSVRYAIQCKRYESNVGNEAVQQVYAGKNYYDCHVAVVLTNRSFTQSARQLAAKNGVLLWGRKELDSLASYLVEVKQPRS